MRNNRTIVYVIGFLFSIPIALTSYINSSFLENYISEYYIGIIYAFASIITIWGLFKMPKILTRLGNRLAALVFSLVIFASLIILSIGKNGALAISAFILYFVASNFILASLDIFVEDFSKNSAIGKFRGIYLMILNSAWVIAQIISGSIIAKSSFQGIYLFSAIFMFLVSFIFIFYLREFKDPQYIKVPILKTLKVFIKNKNISKIYLINFLLKFFFVWMVIYTPIYLHEYLKFGWEQIGIIFTIMLIPFVLVDFPLGKLSDKIGEKKVLIYGFLISAFSVLIIPFIKKPEVILWAAVLFTTRIGAASIEIMSESYFFKEIKEENIGTLSFFRNTYPLAYIIAPLTAIPILLFVPSFKYIFFVLGAVMLLGLLITLRLKDIK